jgi:hypothetical protein
MKTKQKLALGLGALGIASVISGTVASAATDTTVTTSRSVHRAHHEAVHTALRANDYEAFKSAIAQVPRPTGAPEITEAVFAKMVEAEKLRQSGDRAGAQAIMKELGFKAFHQGKGGRGVPPHLTDAQKTAWKEAHTLMHEGKHDEAKAILSAAGITPPTRP